MNILIIGAGGREHALAWKIKKSQFVKNLYIAPGNAGTGEVGVNLNIQVNEFEKIKKAIVDYQIKMIVIGPEEPLVKGISDFLQADPNLKDLHIIGPVQDGAKLEGSKEFAKEFMLRHGIPTARYKSFSNEQLSDGYNFIESLTPPYVLKADGLAAGKGVCIIDNMETAKSELKEMLLGKFGEASKKVVIEEYLKGIELSVFVLTDGLSYLILPEAKDYKRIGEGDTGLNTGGMGAISPVPFADSEFMKKVEHQIIQPTIKGLKKENITYQGFIFFGLIKVNENPFVIEYNARLGDPETEVVIPRINNDLVELLLACSEQKLHETKMLINPDYCTTVVLTSKGYPGNYEKGKTIEMDLPQKDALLFHAGTIKTNNQVLTNGGRVIAVGSFGKSMREALSRSYSLARHINFEGKNFRKDIGFDF